jgi:DNA-binding response OmpR family regulator
MANDLTALVIGASTEELAHVEECLPDWRCVAAPLNDDETTVSSIADEAELIIVYRREAQRDTLAICEQLRNSPHTSAAPILLVIGRYEIAQGIKISHMGNAGFIIAPFSAQRLGEKVAGLRRQR